MESRELAIDAHGAGPPDPARLSLNQITINHQTFAEAVDLCVKHGVKWIAPWRNRIQEIGVMRAARLLRESGLRVSSLCRGGFFPAPTSAQRLERIDDNRKAVDEAAEIGAPLLVLVCGGTPDRDIDGARQMVADGIAALEPYARERGIRLGIEPLHPMFAADRSVIVTLSQALDLALRFDAATVGVVADVFHLWWDPELYSQIDRAAGRIFGFHVSDWAVPLPGILASRSMLGDGVIELRRIRQAVESAGYRGPIEVEILNEQIWAAAPAETLSTVKARYQEFA
jgi:sugar phosphate isomerase/epimerase